MIMRNRVWICDYDNFCYYIEKTKKKTQQSSRRQKPTKAQLNILYGPVSEF